MSRMKLPQAGLLVWMCVMNRVLDTAAASSALSITQCEIMQYTSITCYWKTAEHLNISSYRLEINKQSLSSIRTTRQQRGLTPKPCKQEVLSGTQNTQNTINSFLLAKKLTEEKANENEEQKQEKNTVADVEIMLSHPGQLRDLYTAIKKRQQSLILNINYQECVDCKELRNPPTGIGTESGESTAGTWKWYNLMDEAIGGRPSIQPPILIASSEEESIVPAVSSPDSVPEEAEQEDRRESGEPGPAKRQRKDKDPVLEFLEREAERAGERIRREERREERLLSILEKIVEKM
ncbi:GMP reductase [Labeo rohita]|uniref:GMP reductase n=1 Tax=Labeo rohita TaxID=84645 RepID=A0ABQ8MZT7_LABRO|nr:GMP reductase [Labeo rohita]